MFLLELACLRAALFVYFCINMRTVNFFLFLRFLTSCVFSNLVSFQMSEKELLIGEVRSELVSLQEQHHACNTQLVDCQETVHQLEEQLQQLESPQVDVSSSQQVSGGWITLTSQAVNWRPLWFSLLRVSWWFELQFRTKMEVEKPPWVCEKYHGA